MRVGDRYAQLRLAEPVVAARGDRVVLRADTTVGGGRVLDPAPPRHASAERMELVERGEIAATVHEPVRAESLAHLGELTGVERAGGWVFSRAWLDELRAELERAARRAPTRSIPASRRRPSRGRRRSCRCSGSSGAARSSTGRAPTAELGARAEAAAALEAQLGLEPVKVDDAALARFLEEQGRLVRVGDGFAVSRRGVRAGARGARRRVRAGRAGSRSRASATCSASAARRRSSCSSASTPTA